MIALRFAVQLLLALILTGCATRSHISDVRTGSGDCEVHKITMRSVKVPSPNGCVIPRPGWLQAREQGFPNSYPRWLNSKEDFCIVYVCDECVIAENHWRSEAKEGDDAR